MSIPKRFKRFVFPAIWIVIALFFLGFGTYDYHRQISARVDVLHSYLQLNNYKYLEGRADSIIRVTVLDHKGKVLYDSHKDVSLMESQIGREEVIRAINDGQGYDIVRESSSEGEFCFYSATLFPDVIVRSSLPYDTRLIETLAPNNTVVFYVIITLLLIIFIMHLVNRNKRREEDSHRYKQQFTENAAHELKTPASVIEGYLETLVQNPDIPASQRNEFIGRAFSQAQRMGKILEDMGTLSRLEHGNVGDGTLDTVMDVSEVLNSVLEETRPQFHALGVELLMDYPEHMVMLACPVLLASLVRNIIDNTIIYASQADSFRIHGENIDGKMLKLVFSDNGPGVPEEHLDRIFERFYRLDKGRSRKLGGTGLGLSIVRNIARHYGGDAKAWQTEGGGLTIQITFKTGL